MGFNSGFKGLNMISLSGAVFPRSWRQTPSAKHWTSAAMFLYSCSLAGDLEFSWLTQRVTSDVSQVSTEYVFGR